MSNEEKDRPKWGFNHRGWGYAGNGWPSGREKDDEDDNCPNCDHADGRCKPCEERAVHLKKQAREDRDFDLEL